MIFPNDMDVTASPTAGHSSIADAQHLVCPEQLGKPGDEQLVLYWGRLWLLSDRYWPGTGAGGLGSHMPTPGLRARSRLALRLAGGGLLIATGAIHLDLYLTGYWSIPTIGWPAVQGEVDRPLRAEQSVRPRRDRWAGWRAAHRGRALPLALARSAKMGANIPRHQATSGHNEPAPSQVNGI